MTKICIIGAGVVGLSTAVNIQDRLPGADLTLIADKFGNDTTSDGAAGHFGVREKKTKADPIALRRWAKTSFEWYHHIWSSSEANLAGIHRISGYDLMTQEQPKPQVLTEVIYKFRDLTRQELERLPGNYPYGWFMDTLMVECRRYLPWLLKRFQRKGGKTIKRRINTISEIADGFDIVVNCSGLGSRTLFNDKDMVPIRGHIIRVDAPWIKHFYIADSDTYIYPGQDNIVLGGTRQQGEESMQKEQKYFDSVFSRCATLVPSLKHAKITRTWVGLRPYRSSVRVEAEQLQVRDKIVPIVHNYGQGTDGVCISWGCAVDAADLVVKQVQDLQRSNKLSLKHKL